MSKNDYTTNKIYFVINNIKDFSTKYDSYFLKLPEVYATSTYTYKEVNHYNIQLDFTVGFLKEEDLHLINKCNCSSEDIELFHYANTCFYERVIIQI